MGQETKVKTRVSTVTKVIAGIAIAAGAASIAAAGVVGSREATRTPEASIVRDIDIVVDVDNNADASVSLTTPQVTTIGVMNDGSDGAKNVTTEITFDSLLVISSRSLVNSDSGTSTTCGDEEYSEDMDTVTLTCTHTIPAGKEVLVDLSFMIDSRYAMCDVIEESMDAEDYLIADVSVVATHAKDINSANNDDSESVYLESFLCSDAFVELSIDDVSVMTPVGGTRAITVSVTNISDELTLHELPVSIFAHGGGHLGDDIDVSDATHNSIASIQSIEELTPGMTYEIEDYELTMWNTAVPCEEEGEITLSAGVHYDMDADHSNNTTTLTIPVVGEECE